MLQKLFYLCLFTLVLTTSCKNKNRRIWRGSAGNESSGPSPRDYSVTKANAYNDLFLDSTALEKFLMTDGTADSIRENMLDFYNVRNFQFAWFDSKGLTEQALGFRSLYKYSKDSVNKKLDRQLDELLLHETIINPKDPDIIKIELQLSKRFVRYTLETYKETNLDDHQFETFIPIKKQTILELADSILADKNNKKYAALTPDYQVLKAQLTKYVALHKNKGWDTIAGTKTKFVAGKSFVEIPSIKKRLGVSGELAVVDTGSVFTPELEAAIKKYQVSNGFTPDGKINRILLQSLNTPVLNRIQQLLINMERMRWMPVNKEGKLIVVNIPAFTLHVTEGEKEVIQMPVVVGKEAHQTTMFSDDLTEVVFSPYWNIPRSIVKNEILPAIQKNSNYLQKNHMEVVRNEGGLPVIRQLPGAFNSLGHVKFLFPNSFNIYFHDTPSKNLFGKDDRAASHGCIRLSDPIKMANYLLENAPEWTPAKIAEAMASGVEKTVALKHSVPVIITYYTAWVDKNKQLNFRDDVYGNDKALAAKMFTDAL